MYKSILLTLLGWLFLSVNSYSQPQDFKKTIAESQSDSVVMVSYTELMRSFMQTKIDSAVFYGEQGIELFNKNKYPFGEATLNINLAQIMVFNGSLIKAEAFCNEALRLASIHNLPTITARAYDFLTMIHGEQGNLVKATDFAYRALKAHETLKDDRGIISTYIKLSAIAIGLDKPEEAINFSLLAESVNQSTIKDPRLRVGAYSNRGIALIQTKQFEKALIVFQTIDEIVTGEGYNDYITQVSNLLNLGSVYSNMNDHLNAMQVFQKVLTLAKQHNLPQIENKSTLNIATTYNNLRQYSLSNTFAQRVLKTSIENKAQVEETESLKLIADNYFKLGDYKNAFNYSAQYYEKLLELKDSQNESDIKRLESTYKLEQAEEQLKQANELSELRTKQRDISIWFAVISLIFLVGFVYAYFRIRHLNGKLYELNEEKDKFFSILGHDLRGAYLNNVGFINLLKENNLEKEDLDYLIKEVSQQSQYALETLDNLLMWGVKRMNEGKKVFISEFQTYPIVKNNIDYLQENLTKKNITLQVDWDSDLKIKADENHFSFIIRNLLSNSIKFTPERGTIRLSHQMIGENQVKFSIQDSGVGIEKERLGKIFGSITESTLGTNHEKGSGLGLTLCKEFVELNGGEIGVESEIGKGTTIYFILNLAK